jgi:hypothetical protein
MVIFEKGVPFTDTERNVCRCSKTIWEEVGERYAGNKMSYVLVIAKAGNTDVKVIIQFSLVYMCLKFSIIKR